MKFLVVGSGAREHAIAKALHESPSRPEVCAFMSNNNPGIRKICVDAVAGNTRDAKAVVEFAKKNSVEIAVIGPDAVLEAGISDALWDAGVPTVGPKKAAARLEWDKTFARNLMRKHNIGGCPKFGAFKDADAAGKFIDELGGQVAVKPSGLTAGKGVKVVGFQLADTKEAKEYCNEILSTNMGGLGEVVIEEKLVGQELTLQTFVDGKTVRGMPCVQDHKLAFEGDTGPNCYSEDTEILTDNGWLTFGKLTSEQVATFDPKDKRIGFEKPRAIYWKNYKGKMVSFKNRLIDLVVTPNHRMLVQRRKDKAKTQVVEAQNYEGENYIFQSGRWVGQEPKHFILGEHDYKFNRKLQKKPMPFICWAKFLGIYLSEGYTSKDKSGGSRVYICQTKKSKNIEKMRKILNKIPFPISYREKDSKFRINSIQLANHLKEFGKSHDKYVPDYIKNAKPKTIIAFLEAYCLGDGDWHNGQMRICTSSKRMIDDLQELFVKVGFCGTVTLDKRKTMINPLNRKTYKVSTIYAIEVRKSDKTSIRKSNVKEIDYEGHIGCVTVSTGFVIVRRNRRVAVCGNTGGMGSYSTGELLPFMRRDEYDKGIAIVEQTVAALAAEGIDYKGIIYGQFMLTREGPKVVEFNARFGDPEAMNVLALLETDFADVCRHIVAGTLAEKKVVFSEHATVVKYLVPEGYPQNPAKGEKIEINEKSIARLGAEVYYASVDEKEGVLYSGSSRSIAILGTGDSLEQAERTCEHACSFVKGKLYHRRDIGTKVLVGARVEQMRKIRGG